jgi:uncharacterized membrane protein
MPDGPARRSGSTRTNPDSLAFLIVLLLAGIAICAATPPFQAPDEQSHLLRAAAVADGHLVTYAHVAGVGEYVPASLLNLMAALMPRITRNPAETFRWDEFQTAAAIPFNPEERVFVPYLSGYTAGLLPPTGHLPAAAGIALVRLFDVPALWAFYAARLATMLVSVTLVWLAVRISPMAQWALLLFAFLPMTLFMRSVVSPDGVVLGIASLLVAMVLRTAVGTPGVTMTAIVTIAALSFLLVTAKPSYVFMVALAAGVPFPRWLKARRAVTALLLIAGSTAAGIWCTLWWVRPHQTEAASLAASAERIEVPGLAVITSAPGDVVFRIAADYWSRGPHYLEQFAGRLAWLDVPVPYSVRALVLFALLASLFAAGSASSAIPPHLRMLGVLVFIACIFLTSLAFYDQTRGVVAGIQGRYLIPPALALVCTLANPVLNGLYSMPALNRLFGVIALAGVGGTLSSIGARFHW